MTEQPDTLMQATPEAASETPAPAPSPLAAAIEDAFLQLADPTLTPQGLILAMLKRALAMPVHESRQAEAAAALAEYVRVAIEILRTDTSNTLARLSVLTRKLHALARPQPSVDELAAAEPRLRAAGWTSFEITDCLRGVLRPGEKILGVTDHDIRLESRTLSRREVRDMGRPQTWTNDETWHRQCGGEIPGEERGNRDASRETAG